MPKIELKTGIPSLHTLRSMAGAKDSHSFLTWVISPMSNALGVAMMEAGDSVGI
jgi:hypothetical protein